MTSIAIIGKPNSGKSLLFNQLTGLQQTVANFPGVTVEVHSGKFQDITLRDFPGIYSVNPITKDEQVAVDKLKEALSNPDLSGVLCLLDATRLERSLVLGLQVLKLCQEAKKPLLFAVNMIDELINNKQAINISGLSSALGVTIIDISAKSGHHLDLLKSNLKNLVAHPEKFNSSQYQVRLDPIVHAKKLAAQFGPSTDVLLKSQNRIDHFFLSSFWGGTIFLLAMAFLFQSIFTWSAPAMQFVQDTLAQAGTFFSQAFRGGIISDFIKDALFGGFGSFLVFVPQIFILTFIIGILEDTGYLARASIICHRPLGLFGLSGKSFVPMLSGHACAIPAIMSTRTIESPRKRLLTIITIPLMSCSARLPVYSLLITAMIPNQRFLGGIIGLQGLTFFGMYVFGLVSALFIAGILSKTAVKKTGDAPFIIELPPYRIPGWRPLIGKSIRQSTEFLTEAGPIIFTVTMVVWFLGYFPNGAGHLDTSYLASLGRLIEPAVRPLGLDWKFGVAILSSFVAREVFVGTLGTLYGIESAKENVSGLAQSIQSSGLTLASGLALLVFYALALQCASTIAVMKKETGRRFLPMIVFACYGFLAYIGAYLTYSFFH